MKNSYKKIISVVLTIIILLTAAPMSGFVGLKLNLDWLNFDWLDFSTKSSALAATGQCGDNVFWSFDESSGTLTISGTGDMYNYIRDSYNRSPFFYNRSITSIVIESGITSIGNNAFSYCDGLTIVTIGNSVTSIGWDAFSCCTGLTSITIPDSVTSIGESAFNGCTGLTSITIPDSVTSIGEWSFLGCTGLTSITIPDSVTSIGASAFNDCAGLTSVTIGNSVTSIGYSAFSGCTGLTSVTIPDSVTSIGEYAFKGCTGLTTVNFNAAECEEMDSVFYGCSSFTTLIIGETVKKIPDSAFSNCTGLTSATIGNSVTSIGNDAFCYCAGLTSITIPDSVMSIGYSVFYGCTGLTSVTIPDSVTSICDGAFIGCTRLISITIPDSITSIGIFAFDNTGYYNDSSNWENDVLYIGNHLIEAKSSVSGDYTIKSGTYCIGNSAFIGCTGLTSITIPDSVTSIGYYAFSGCTGLTSITIPDSVTSIGDGVFIGCAGLTSITIPDSVTSIGGHAFEGCIGLTSVTIPDSVTSIVEKVFYRCTGLTSVTIGNSVTSIESNAFPDNVVLICKNQYSLDYAKNGNYMYLISFIPGDEDVAVSENLTNKCRYIIDKSTGTLTVNCDGAIPSFQTQEAPWLQYKNNILKVVVNEGCTKISYNAFKDLWMSDIEIPSTVTAIDNYAFSNCTRLTSITIPDSVTTIGNYVFSGCSQLEKAIVSDKATSIGSYEFENCFNLKELTIPCNLYLNCYDYNKRYKFENITFTKGTRRMYNYYSESSTLWYYTKNTVKSITLEEGITSIGNYAFYECPVSISIPSTVTSIGNYAFYGCTTMEDVVLSENVQSIGASSFANVKTIKVYNSNCTFGADCIPYNATIYGYAGSTAEAFANENGYNFEYLGEGHEHLYDNDCDTICNICGFTRTVTHSYDSDCDDTCNICGARRTPNHHYAWVTIRNATTTEEGLAQKKCTVCGYVTEEFTIPVMVADFVTGITISPKTIALNVGETADITALITPETATNKNIIWSSTDSENAAVSGGTVTAVRPGTSVIIAETEDGGYRDFCQVRVISLTASNGAVVNSESGLVYGLAPKLGSIDGYIDTVDDSISAVCEDSVIGTGSVIQIVRDGELIDSYKAVIFGDVNSDGVYDGQDAFIVNCIANGMLTRDQVGEAKFLAADCNHDGEVNSSDVLILEQAGLLLSKVEQAKDEEMKEQALGEYLDLIDQNPEKETESEDGDFAIISIFKYVVNLIKKCFDYIISTFFPKV